MLGIQRRIGAFVLVLKKRRIFVALICLICSIVSVMLWKGKSPSNIWIKRRPLPVEILDQCSLEWNVDKSSVEATDGLVLRAMGDYLWPKKEMIATEYGEFSLRKGVTYLAAKGLWEGKDRRGIAAGAVTIAFDSQGHMDDGRAFLFQLLELGKDVVSDSVPAGVQTWDEFVRSQGLSVDWNKEYVFFRDDPKWKAAYGAVPAQRRQRRENCHGHAADFIVHGATVKRSGAAMPTFDRTELMLKNGSREELRRRVFLGGKGDSIADLEALAGASNVMEVPNLATADFKGLLVDHGPLLVARWPISREWETAGVMRVTDAKSGSGQLHAAAMVGATDNELLFQNWWAAKQFVEVPRSTLIASGARVLYVKPNGPLPDVSPARRATAYSEGIGSMEGTAEEGGLLA